MPQAAPAPRRTFHNTALRSVLLVSVALSLTVLWVSHRAIASHAKREDTTQLLSVPLPPPRRDAAKGGLPPIPDFVKAKMAEVSFEDKNADKETNDATVGDGGAQSFPLPSDAVPDQSVPSGVILQPGPSKVSTIAVFPLLLVGIQF
ncbi:hypothetical protein ACHAXT_000443 [Thalassiosira profunda]